MAQWGGIVCVFGFRAETCGTSTAYGHVAGDVASGQTVIQTLVHLHKLCEEVFELDFTSIILGCVRWREVSGVGVAEKFQ